MNEKRKNIGEVSNDGPPLRPDGTPFRAPFGVMPEEEPEKNEETPAEGPGPFRMPFGVVPDDDR